VATLSDAHNLARSLLGERQSPPEVFTDTFLLTLSPEVYREIQRRLTLAGFPQLRDYVTFTVLTNVTSVTDGHAGYPTTVIKPLRLWERSSGSTAFSDFVLMEQADPELVPRAQTAILSHWQWQTKSILLVGASADRTVRMFYSKFLTDLTATSDTLAIADSVGAMAYGTAAAAARSRGSDLAADLEKVFESMVKELITREAF
jgi:hypothetical protein